MKGTSIDMLINDPTVNFPAHPMLLPNVQVVEDNGVIIYGSPDGPFRINGKNVILIFNELIPLLKEKNTIESLVAKCTLKEKIIIKVLETLFLHGCIIEFIETEEQELTPLDKYFIHNITFTHNYNCIEEVHERKNQININIISFDESITRRVKAILEKYGFCVNSSKEVNSDDWYIYISNDFLNEQVYTLSEQTNLLFIKITSEKIQLGPIISRKTINRYPEIVGIPEYEEKIDINLSYISNLISMTVLKEVLYLSSGKLAQGFITINRNKSEYKKLSKTRTYSLIDRYEEEIMFPPTEFINKSNHLTHYKPSNLKLGIKEYKPSFLWEKIENNNLESKLLQLIKYTVGFKADGIKKYSPTGGNINSNLLFLINLEKKYLGGKGLFYFNNKDEYFYKVNNITESEIVRIIPTPFKYRALIILGSDTDIIAKKYSDFAFKLANLNTGILLSQILSINAELNLDLEFISSYDEVHIREMIGIKYSNEIFNYIIGVI